MNALYVRIAGLVLLCMLGSSPALAGKKDEAWAKCLWERVPTTAANWLAMTPPAKRDWAAPETPDLIVYYRLRAACERVLTPPGKKNAPGLDVKSVRAVLTATRPANVGADKVEPNAWRCDYFFENDLQLKTRARFEWGFEDAVGREIWTTTEFGFARVGGGTVSLAKDGGIKKCFVVQADGTLTDA